MVIVGLASIVAGVVCLVDLTVTILRAHHRKKARAQWIADQAYETSHMRFWLEAQRDARLLMLPRWKWWLGVR